MKNKNNKAATAQIGESVQTDAVSAQSQPTTAPGGTTTLNAPDVAGAEATATTTQSIATIDNTLSIGEESSGGTFVPANLRFTETQYEPSADVTREDVSKLSQDDLLTGLKKQYNITSKSHELFGRDLSVLVLFYDQVVATFKDERVSVNREGKPTLREAFFAIGWNYEAARKMKQRYNASMAAIPAYAPCPKPLQLTPGDLVMEKGQDGVYTVINVHESSSAVDIVPDGEDRTNPVTVAADSLKKFSKTVRKVKVGDLVLCEDNGAEYEYVGGGKFSRTETPSILQQKRQREEEAIRRSKERLEAKAREKAEQQRQRKAEAARRELERVAEKERHNADAVAKKQGARKKKAETAAKKATGAKNEPATNGQQQQEANAKASAASPGTPSRSETKPAAVRRVRERRYGKNQLTVKNGCVYVIGAPGLGAIACFEGDDRTDQAWNEVERLTAPQTSALEGGVVDVALVR